MSAALTIRTPSGEQVLELEEFEARVARGEIDPATLVQFPPVTGPRFVRAGELELFRGLYEPKALYFSRAFHLGRIPAITLALSLANLAVFTLERRDGPIDLSVMVAHGAKAGPLIHDLGELWRLLTANFVHRDAAHIGFNLFVLFHFGAALENAFRPLDYLWILVATALGTTGLSLAMSDAVSAGASGLAYGMLGGAMVFGLKYRRILPERYRRVLGSAVVPTVLVLLYIGWTSTGVDNWGHVGGLVAGAASTALFPPRLLGEPVSARRRWFTRALPLGLTLAAVTFGGRALAGRLPVLERISDERSGLSLGIPAGWRRGGETQDALAFTNGLPGAARASLSISARAADELAEPAGIDVEAEARAFARTALVAEEEAGRISSLQVDPPRYAHVAGLLGVRVEARLVSEGVPTRLAAHLFARGEIVHTLVFVRPEGLPAYDAVLARVLASVRPEEPVFVREARGRAQVAPADLEAWLQLAEAERRVGNGAAARQALVTAGLLAPSEAEPLRALAGLTLAEGLVREGCALAGRALALAPKDPATLATVAHCAWASGDRRTARARLVEAVRLAPDDPRLLARLSRLSDEEDG